MILRHSMLVPAMLFHCMLLCGLLVAPAPLAADDITPILTLLREQPEDDAVLERAVAWAERRAPLCDDTCIIRCGLTIFIRRCSGKCRRRN